MVPLTRGGWTVLAIGVVSAILAFLLRWQELAVIALGCLLLLVLSLPFVVGHLNVDVARSVEPTVVTRGERAVSLLSVTSGSARTRTGIAIEDAVGNKVVPVRVPPLRPGAQHDVPYDLPTSRRGLVSIGPARLVRTDPLGLYLRQRLLGDRTELTVWPKSHRVMITASGLAKDLDGPTSDSSPEGGDTFHAVREYTPGDDYRLVHWRSTAKTGFASLMVRQFVDNRRPLLVVALDNGAVYAGGDFELAVEIAASIVESGEAAGVPTVLVSSESSQPTSMRTLSLNRLAAIGVRDDEKGDELHHVCHHATRVSSSAASVVLITGERDQIALSGATSRIPAASLELIRVVRHIGAPIVYPPRTRFVDVDSVERFVASWRGGAR